MTSNCLPPASSARTTESTCQVTPSICPVPNAGKIGTLHVPFSINGPYREGTNSHNTIENVIINFDTPPYVRRPHHEGINSDGNVPNGASIDTTDTPATLPDATADVGVDQGDGKLGIKHLSIQLFDTLALNIQTFSLYQWYKDWDTQREGKAMIRTLSCMIYWQCKILIRDLTSAPNDVMAESLLIVIFVLTTWVFLQW
ncbi:hypothetical protein BJ875DRAFT_482881 [Amylocarpus encephaloides]|uniref:Uncharacterized protein n=1 Tax=Amylocarpus encephaloides TaxID=45428 RepID=A0A9P7YLI8_9HELO|nr:hypothetical protein BJ875DRAFT_482881 [Amylocarpus encephaloides]